MLRLFTALVWAITAYALGGPRCVSFTPDGALTLALKQKGYALPILLDSRDPAPVHVAAQTFADDIQRVAGIRPQSFNDTLPTSATRAIIIGTAGSDLLSSIGDISRLEGLWESYDIRVMDNPIGGVEEALIITGSDKRGVVYGMYELSAQMGVSPWYWWSDVPVIPRETISFTTSAICSHGEPTVKYRGFFINDEQPVLWSWAKDHFQIPANEPPFQTSMYEPMLELALRLKANYFWPAMWHSMFDVDGMDVSGGLPKQPIPGPNQELADRMGIVMGTSHQEPMARNTEEWNGYGEGPWNFTSNSEYLTEFWRYGAERAKDHDTLFTVGMRGNGDLPLPGANIPVMENITAAQQQILREVYGSDIKHIPQMWAMYKEVMGYFANGMTIPDDVTPLLADDNWGNLMAVMPPGSNHTAGGGVYYHADYVGDPRDYKWINTVPMAKNAHRRRVQYDEIWILNVGDMKLLEIPLEYFLNLAYDTERWPRNSLTEYLALWAMRDFGLGSKDACEVADIMGHYQMYASRIKPELLNSTVFSLINYDEAEKITSDWSSLEYRSKCIHDKLDTHTQATYFEMVHASIMLNANLNRLYLAAGKSNMYATQGRTAANIQANKALALFENDVTISQQFESLYDGKWTHMLSQPHIGYQYWQGPMRNSLPPISYIQSSTFSSPHYLSAIRYTVENSLGAWPGDNLHNCFLGYACPDPTLITMTPYGAATRWIEVSSGGPRDVDWTATPNATWIKVHPTSGSTKGDGSANTRVYISIDWDHIPVGSSVTGTVNFTSADGATMMATVPAYHTIAPPADWHGHVEGDGYIVMEAAHHTGNDTSHGYTWQEIDWYGRTHSGVEMFPTTSQNFSVGDGPVLSYDVWVTTPISEVDITIQVGPSLNFMLGNFLSFAIQLDDDTPQQINPVPAAALGSTPPDWNQVVSDEIRSVVIPMTVNWTDPKAHTLKLWGMTTGVVVERLMLDFGGIKERGYNYLGPPESTIVSPQVRWFSIQTE